MNKEGKTKENTFCILFFVISYRIFAFIRKKECGVNLRNKGKLLSAAAAAVVRGINMHTNRAAAGDRILMFSVSSARAKLYIIIE